MPDRILLILGIGNSESAEELAFNLAQSTSQEIVALQILNSDLYHYGHNDLIATRPSKIQFLLHIRSEVVACANVKAGELQERSRRQRVALEIRSVETEDVGSAVIAEASKGYNIIFLPKEKQKLFPLLEKTIEQRLLKNVSCPVVPC